MSFRIRIILGAVLVAVGIAWGLYARSQYQARHAYENLGRPEVREAVAIVKKPGWETDQSGPRCQTGLRLALINYEHSELMHYRFEPADSIVWRGLLHDTDASHYARDCAAYFLLETDAAARSYLEKEMRSDDPRRRFNASTILAFHFQRMTFSGDDGAACEWTVTQAIDLLAQGFLDRIDNKETQGGIQGGQGEEHDSTDIMSSPVWEICNFLGHRREKRAVEALIRHLERDTKNPSAAFALGQIGDIRAVPVLLRMLKEKSGYDLSEADALAALNCQEAVPVLGERLVEISTPDDDKLKEDFRQIHANRILDALLKLRNPKAAVPIRTYLQKNSNPSVRPNIERVLIQLESVEPVPQLIRMLESAGVGAAQDPGATARIGPTSHFLQHGGDEHYQATLIQDLSTYTSPLVTGKLVEVARSSESAFLRREAIFGLGRSSAPESLEKLASLLNITFPENLRTTWGWKSAPQSVDAELKRAILQALKHRTGQDLGPSHEKWERWLSTREQR